MQPTACDTEPTTVPPHRSRPSPICFPRSFPLVCLLLPEAGPTPPGLCCGGTVCAWRRRQERPPGQLGDWAAPWIRTTVGGMERRVGRSSVSREGWGGQDARLTFQRRGMCFHLRSQSWWRQGRGRVAGPDLWGPSTPAWTHLSQLLLSRPGSSILGTWRCSGLPPRLCLAPFVLWTRGLSQDSSALGTSRRSADNLGCRERESAMPLSVPPCTASLARG